WRETSNPYHILLAEKLLQQTASRPHLVRIYHTLVSRFPDPQAIISAPVGELRALIFPLGLPQRADEIRILSEQIVDDFSGQVPCSREELFSLVGVGEHIARAVLCFACGYQVAVVDTN